jgi:hypothetical protein
MAILGKITWFISASSKRKNIMKSVMKDDGQVAVKAIVHALSKSPSNASSAFSRISRKDVASVRA